MQEIRRRKAFAVDLRARLPLLTRLLALLILAAVVSVVSISYYKRRNNERFRMRGEAPELSKQVEAIIEGYEQRVTEGDRLRLFVKAARDVRYTDGHHELEEVHLESYPVNSDKPDRITAQRAIYLPGADAPNKGRMWFKGNVNIETRDALKAQTESIAYDQQSEVAETDAQITFTRANISGRSTGALLNTRNKQLELNSAVEITVTPEAKDGGAKANPRSLIIRAGHATVYQATSILVFSGGATAVQDQDVMSGDKLAASLNEHQRLQKVEARGNSYLRTMTEGRAAEVHAADMNFFLDADQQLQRAVATREVRVRSLDAASEMQLTGANSLEVNFQSQGNRSLLREMRTDGRSVLSLAAPQSRANDPRAANKRLTADSVKLIWRATGRDLERAEAVGNAELVIDPVQKSALAERKTLTAPRFDCYFNESGNLARTATATGGGIKAIIEPLQPTEERAIRTLTSQQMTAAFMRDTQDVERLDAQGDAKFNELDRNGRAANASYTAADETVRLRGDEPTVWDSRARIKAAEIDSDLRNDISYSRGKTATTYYSQEQTGGATPFAKVKSPVFIVADRAEFRHTTGVAIYTGAARAWQDDNFVRADRLTIYRENKRMEGEGSVQSALYQIKRRNANGSNDVVPVFASAERMFYSDTDRLLHYEGNVDIKQGTERITSAVSDIYLLKNTNEVEKTIAQRNVVLTQPGRRGVGEWAQYTMADETVVLKGDPARVEDVEQGTSESGRLTVYLRESRVIADDTRGAQSPGRVRSTHKIKRQ